MAGLSACVFRYFSVLLLFACCLVFSGIRVKADSGDLPRVYCGAAVGSNSNYQTVLTSDGSRLRAGKMVVTKEYFFDVANDSFYQALKDAGLNAVRVTCFDAYYRRHPNLAPQYSPPSTTFNLNPASGTNNIAELQSRLDVVVDKCRYYGLYAIINCHDIGYDFDATYFSQFWNVVAPRYKNRTHVIYELVNEIDWKEVDPNASVISLVPYGLNHPGTANSSNPEAPWKIVDKLLPLHTLVRGLAPDTHISLFSFALTNRSFAGWWDMKGMASDITQKSLTTSKPIDWTKTSLNFHNYEYANLPVSESSITSTALVYPVICGEVGFTPSVSTFLATGSNSYGGKLKTDENCATTSLERLKLSWAHWDLDWPSPYQNDKFRQNYKVLLNDLLYHGQFWSDTWLPPYVYVITSRYGATSPGTGKAISVDNGVSWGSNLVDGAKLVLYTNAWGDFQKVRLFDQSWNGQSFFRFQYIGSGKAWDVPSNQLGIPAPLQQWAYNTATNPTNQHFSIQKVNGTAYFRIHSRSAPNMVVNLAGPSTAEGTTIQQYQMSSTGNWEEHWHFVSTEIP